MEILLFFVHNLELLWVKFVQEMNKINFSHLTYFNNFDFLQFSVGHDFMIANISNNIKSAKFP
jgi:hypothetical protein